jgi:hypothetical protein
MRHLSLRLALLPFDGCHCLEAVPSTGIHHFAKGVEARLLASPVVGRDLRMNVVVVVGHRGFVLVALCV